MDPKYTNIQYAKILGLWAVVHQVVQDRPGAVEVVWVRGHKDNQGNSLADSVAKSAAQEAKTSWHVDLGAQQEIDRFACSQRTLVETDPRQLLKQQTTIRLHQAWTSQKRTKRAFVDLDDAEWRSTL
ncbi:hypothetical protein BGZ50_003982, partial [Haplosporangium sp. Z 11]